MVPFVLCIERPQVLVGVQVLDHSYVDVLNDLFETGFRQELEDYLIRDNLQNQVKWLQPYLNLLKVIFRYSYFQ